MLDRYQLRRELHVGDSGEVWLVRERDTRELYAARIGFGDAARRVKTEALVLSQIDHPGLPRFVDQGPVDGEDGEEGWCTVCENIDGATLGKVIRVATPAPPMAAAWMRQIALAVARLHDAGIVHGDLHPDHIIVARDHAGRDRLVLVGLGSASREGERRKISASAHAVAAPELLRGEPARAASDIYALGAILYRMLADRWPFIGPEPAVHEAHVSTPPPPLGRHSRSLRLPPGLESLVFRCLEKDPVLRLSSANELAEALGGVVFAPQRDWVPVTGTGEPETRVARPEPRPKESDPRLTVLLAVGGLLLAIAALAWWL